LLVTKFDMPVKPVNATDVAGMVAAPPAMMIAPVTPDGLIAPGLMTQLDWLLPDNPTDDAAIGLAGLTPRQTCTVVAPP
jgi:hypothetical protein